MGLVAKNEIKIPQRDYVSRWGLLPRHTLRADDGRVNRVLVRRNALD